MTPDEYDYKMSTCVPALFGHVYYARKIIEVRSHPGDFKISTILVCGIE